MTQQTTAERILGIGFLASLIASFMIGVGARIIMRIVAFTAHIPPNFSVPGTLNIVLLALLLGLVPGFVYTLCMFILSSSPKVSKHLPCSLWRGLVFGVLLLLIGGLPSVLIPLLPKKDLNLGIPFLNRSMFAALLLIYGIILGGAKPSSTATFLTNQHLPCKSGTGSNFALIESISEPAREPLTAIVFQEQRTNHHWLSRL